MKQKLKHMWNEHPEEVFGFIIGIASIAVTVVGIRTNRQFNRIYREANTNYIALHSEQV